MNPLLMPYIGERCPQCGRTFKTAKDLEHTKFGANAYPVHTECWDAYTGEMVQAVRVFAEHIWAHCEKDASNYHVDLTKEDMALISKWVRPARNH